MDRSPDNSHPQEKIIPLTLYVRPDQIEWLTERAERQGVPVHEVVQRLIAEARWGKRDGQEAGRSSASPSGSPDPSVLNQLRGAKKKLEALRGAADATADEQAGNERPPVPGDSDNPPPSMFELVEEESGPRAED